MDLFGDLVERPDYRLERERDGSLLSNLQSTVDTDAVDARDSVRVREVRGEEVGACRGRGLDNKVVSRLSWARIFWAPARFNVTYAM